MSLFIRSQKSSEDLLKIAEQLILHENTFKVNNFRDKSNPNHANLMVCFEQVARKERNKLQQLFKIILTRSQSSEEAIVISLQAAHRLLSVYPHLIDIFLFSVRGSILEQVLRECQIQSSEGDCMYSKFNVVRTARRLLSLSPSGLIENWDWSPLVALFSDASLKVRVEAVHAVGLCLSLSEHEIDSMIGLLRQDLIEDIEDSQFDDESESDLERAKLFISGLVNSSSDLPSSSTASNHMNFSHTESASARESVKSDAINRNFASLFLETEIANQSCTSDKEFVHTMTTCKNLESIAIALCQKRPILVEGPSGSGKTALIEYVATLTGNSNSMIRVHLDDQMDSKTLVGSYVCTETPGEFMWQAGALTQAMEQVRVRHSPTPGCSPPPIMPPAVLLSRRGVRLTTGSCANHARATWLTRGEPGVVRGASDPNRANG